MSQPRRGFLKKMSLLAGASLTTTFNSEAWSLINKKQRSFENEDDFWFQIQKSYKQSPHFINLEAGYFSPQATEVMEGQIENIEMINETPSYYMRTRQWEDRARIREMIAEFGGVSDEEVVITRNTTESLNTIILGYPWEKGDEAVMNVQDYPNMLEAFAMAEKRYGMVRKFIDMPVHPTSDEEVVSIYEKAITKKTKVILVTHLINISGQILPVRKIADMAHSHGVEVIVDGAHTFAQLDFKIPDLNADYYGASLHKWLCCPLGLGVLYIKKDHINKIWPLFGDTSQDVASIDKFERTGTLPLSSHRTIANAIKFHNSIGSERKEQRLRYLKDYWVNQVKDIPGVTFNTPLEKERSCAISNIAMEGYEPDDLAKALMDEYRIFTVAINNEVIKGVRVTPHLYTTLDDLDTMVRAIKELSEY